MERITVPGPDGGFSVPAGLEQEAAERLGRYEDAHGRLLARQEELAGRMEALKAQGKQKTVSRAWRLAGDIDQLGHAVVDGGMEQMELPLLRQRPEQRNAAPL